MIKKLVLKNFKSIKEQTYEFSQFDLLVGRNNSGKSTVLQALAIWQFSIDAFKRTKRGGNTGIQVILPNFTALPLPEFNLLWAEKTDRRYPEIGGKKKQEFILIEIEVTWLTNDQQELSFGIKLRYNSPQTIYTIPTDGWKRFRELAGDPGDGKNKPAIPSLLPTIVYVPPFSGLEDIEEWRDDGPMRQQVGKAQPGRVLRNLLLRVWEKHKEDWQEIREVVHRWFSVDLQTPKYEHGISTQILCEYKQGDKTYDIIAGGSGFHQTLTLLAFFYGYRPDTILLDEPDAHLHVNLQREVLDYFKFFKDKSKEKNVQFLIATHAEEFIRGVDVKQIYSFLSKAKEPKRVSSSPEVLIAMSDVNNLEVAQLQQSELPFMLYVEGETDDRILRAWATVLGFTESLGKVCFRFMGGGSKKIMKEAADRHFSGIQQIIPQVKRLMVFDYDDDETAFHPSNDNPVLHEWQRKNIENYLLIPDIWIRAFQLHYHWGPLLEHPIIQLINDFFVGENLTLPHGQTWQDVKANIFKVVNGKKILFENETSLFQQLRHQNPPIELTRETIASYIREEEIHNDIRLFFRKLQNQLQTSA